MSNAFSLLVGIIVISALAFTTPSFRINGNVLETSEMPFLSHKGEGPFSSYLVQNVSYAPVRELFQSVKASTGKQLENRGEAHITVVTPVEYFQVLKLHLSIEEINRLAEKYEIQRAPFDLECLGHGRATVEGQKREAYFIVVKSETLLELRRAIHHLFIAKGGASDAFDPELFFPHITVGFLGQDVHYENGVRKDRSSCVADLVLK